jgi:hypothetical protein
VQKSGKGTHTVQISWVSFLFHIKNIVLLPHVLQLLQVIRVAKRIDQRCKDLMIFTTRVQIPLWDVVTGPSYETV